MHALPPRRCLIVARPRLRRNFPTAGIRATVKQDLQAGVAIRGSNLSLTPKDASVTPPVG